MRFSFPIPSSRLSRLARVYTSPILAMSSDSHSHAHAFLPIPEDDGRALFSTAESGSQPTSTMGGDTYNKSYVGWDMPGTAFDMEFEALDSYTQNGPEMAALPTDLWSDWTYLPPDIEGTPLATFAAFNPRRTGDALCDTISGPHLLDSDQFKFFPFPRFLSQQSRDNTHRPYLDFSIQSA
jgi:hypothetical protein